MFTNDTVITIVTIRVIIYSLVNTHKKDKKPDSPSSRHRTARQSSIPSSIPSPKQGSLSSGNDNTSLSR